MLKNRVKMSELKKFQIINKMEGISYIILIFAAMPLKYIFLIPLATKVVGAIHGILVIIFFYQIFLAKKEANISYVKTFYYSILSLLPFGSFYIDKDLRTT